MQVTILTHARCPVCSYRSQGVRVGTARPGMRQVRVTSSIGFHPAHCDECDHPLGYDQPDRSMFDPATTAALAAWQQRQRDRQAARRAAP